MCKHIRSCHTCQITGKPNQKVACCSVAAYFRRFPFPSSVRAFDKLTVLGPLPRSKTGHQYLLSNRYVPTTRYPAAYSVKVHHYKSVLKASLFYVYLWNSQSYSGPIRVRTSCQNSLLKSPASTSSRPQYFLVPIIRRVKEFLRGFIKP